MSSYLRRTHGKSRPSASLTRATPETWVVVDAVARVAGDVCVGGGLLTLPDRLTVPVVREGMGLAF